jgi:hypothetical protein
MAYQTGTATGASALLTALSTFMQANGWTLIDTLEAGKDLVFKSTGTSGKFPMIMRISDRSRTTNNSIRAAYHPHKAVPGLEVRGYHLWLSPTGTAMATPATATPVASTTGGTLAAGTYYYRVSAIGITGETLANAEQSVVTTGTTSSVTVKWGAVEGAQGYKIYGRSTGAEQLLTTVWGQFTVQWVDTNAITPSGALPGSNSAHSGYYEYGLGGYAIDYVPMNGTKSGQLTNWRLDNALTGPTPPVNPSGYSLPNYLTWTTTDNGWAHKYYGDRYVVGPASGNPTRLRFTDISSGEVWFSSFNPNGNQISAGALEPVYDSSTDKWYIYCLSNTGFVAADGMWRYDVDADTWSRMAAVPWTAAAASGWILWDGADTLYCMRGNNSTDFHKYSISGNSWTALTVAPVGRSTNGFIYGNNGGGIQCWTYVPASASGLGSDVIYTMLDDNSNNLYCYNVTANAWNQASTPNLTTSTGLPYQSYHGDTMLYDGGQYMWLMRKDTNTLVYRMNVQTIYTKGFDANGNLFDQASEYSGGGAWVWNHVLARLHVAPSLSTTYHFIGDSDGIKVAVNNGGLGKYYFMYFGRIVGRRRNTIMTTTTSSYGPGTNTTITVDSTSGYSTGDRVYVFDPATAKQETAKIYSINSGTSMSLTLANTYTVGTLIATDPFQTVITSDIGIAGAPADPGGYKADMEQAWYFFVPSFLEVANAGTLPAYNTSIANQIAPDGNGYYQPLEGLLYHGYWVNNSNVANPLTRTGWMGTVKDIFFLPKTSAGPQNNDILPINGKNYLYFNMQSNIRNSVWSYGTILGPIN